MRLGVTYKFGKFSPEPGRIRNLPPEEQSLFWNWLVANGQTRPKIVGLPDEDQDFFFAHDYEDWKNGSRKDCITV